MEPTNDPVARPPGGLSYAEAGAAAARSAARRRRDRLILAALTGAIAAASVAVNLGPALGGVTPALGRAALGALGLLAALAMWLRPRQGWLLGLLWAAIQIPFYAWTPDGSPTAQVLNIPLTLTESATVNGQVTSYSSVGMNLIGVIYTIWLAKQRALFTRPG